MPPCLNRPIRIKVSEPYSHPDMETDADLPDSGGHYYDNDSGGLLSIVERNANAAVSEFESGDAGGLIAGFTVASLFTYAVKRVITNG